MEEREDEGIGDVPPGYHFSPYSSELVEAYLRSRLLNLPLECQAIKELNIYNFHPRDILGNTPAGKHLYFFTPRKMKYPNGTRPARGTNGGYWKASGKDIIIRDDSKREIGHKMSLVFYEGHQHNGKRTNWLMQEYTIKEFWFPTNQNKNELGAMALCEIYLKPTSNQSSDGELQVDEQDEEEEGSASHCSDNKDMEDNIFADRNVRPRPAPCYHGNDQGRASVASTSGCPLDSPSAISPITARPRPSMPFMGYNNLRSHNMVLSPQSSLRPRGPHTIGYSGSYQIWPLRAQHQPGHVAFSSSFSNTGGVLQPRASNLPNGNTVPISSVQLDDLVQSFCRHGVVSAPSSSQFGNSTSSSFRNQMMLPRQHMPHGEMPSPDFGNATASSSQYQLPLQHMPHGEMPSSDFGNATASSSQYQLPPQHMPHREMPSSDFGNAAASSSQYQPPPKHM